VRDTNVKESHPQAVSISPTKMQNYLT